MTKNFERRLERLEERDKPIRILIAGPGETQAEVQARYPGEKVVVIDHADRGL